MRRFVYILGIAGMLAGLVGALPAAAQAAAMSPPPMAGLETVGGTIAEVEEENKFLLDGDGKDYLVDLGPFQFADLEMQPGVYVTVIGRVDLNSLAAYTIIRPDGAIIEVRSPEAEALPPQSMAEVAAAEQTQKTMGPQIPPLEERVDPENLAKPPRWDASWDRPLELGPLGRPEALPAPRERVMADPGAVALPVSNDAPVAKQDLSSILGELTARSKDIRLQQGQEVGGSLAPGETQASMYRLPPEELMAIASGKRNENDPTWVGEMNQAQVNEAALQRNLQHNQELAAQETQAAAPVSDVAAMPMFELTPDVAARRTQQNAAAVQDVRPMAAPAPVTWFEVKQSELVAPPAPVAAAPAPPIAPPAVASKSSSGEPEGETAGEMAQAMAREMAGRMRAPTPALPPVAVPPGAMPGAMGMATTPAGGAQVMTQQPTEAPAQAAAGYSRRPVLDFPSYSAVAPTAPEERQSASAPLSLRPSSPPMMTRPDAMPAAVAPAVTAAPASAPAATGWFEVRQETAAPQQPQVVSGVSERVGHSVVNQMPSFSAMAEQRQGRAALPAAAAAAPAPTAGGWFEVPQAAPSATQQNDLARQVGTAKRNASPPVSGPVSGRLSMEQMIYGLQ